MRPYDRQYENSYAPYPSTAAGWIIWLIFRMPGTVLLWAGYMFPNHGDVWASRRRAENRVLQVGYSLAFWVGLAVLYALATTPYGNERYFQPTANGKRSSVDAPAAPSIEAPVFACNDAYVRNQLASRQAWNRLANADDVTRFFDEANFQVEDLQTFSTDFGLECAATLKASLPKGGVAWTKTSWLIWKDQGGKPRVFWSDAPLATMRVFEALH